MDKSLSPFTRPRFVMVCVFRERLFPLSSPSALFSICAASIESVFPASIFLLLVSVPVVSIERFSPARVMP